jgi:predicted Fe-Mo cluster-binding NifX family protein
MKIAVPVTQNNQIDDHFGHCEFYSVFTISENNEIENVSVLKSEQGCGCKSNIAVILAADGVTKMLAGGIGGGAINVLNGAGIEVIRGCSGNASDAVGKYLAGLIKDNGQVCEQHEHHKDGDHSHTCKN